MSERLSGFFNRVVGFLTFLEILCPSNDCLFLIWFYFLCFDRAVSQLAASTLYLQSPRPFPVLATVSPVAGFDSMQQRRDCATKVHPKNGGRFCMPL